MMFQPHTEVAPAPFADAARAFSRADSPAEIELLDLETFEVPRRLSDDDRLTHTGGEGRRQARTEPEQDDEQ